MRMSMIFRKRAVNLKKKKRVYANPPPLGFFLFCISYLRGGGADLPST